MTLRQIYNFKALDQSRWVVEIVTLNVSTTNPIGLIPRLFILTTFILTIEGCTIRPSEEKIKASMLKLLNPFFKELQNMFCDAFSVKYNYHPNFISEHLSDGPCEKTIRAMLWLVIGNLPTQCKTDMLKLSGTSAWRMCKKHAKLKDNRYIYGQNCEQFCIPPLAQDFTKSWSAVDD